jgi:outer membrane receptor protein involved in Fe transport
MFTVGANVVGTGSSYAQDNNLLKLPAFTQVNAFLSVRPTERVQLSLNANNLFNTTGFTEAEEDSIPANGIIRARSISGRSVSAAIKFDF